MLFTAEDGVINYRRQFVSSVTPPPRLDQRDMSRFLGLRHLELFLSGPVSVSEVLFRVHRYRNTGYRHDPPHPSPSRQSVKRHFIIKSTNQFAAHRNICQPSSLPTSLKSRDIRVLPRLREVTHTKITSPRRNPPTSRFLREKHRISVSVSMFVAYR
jgi:hypothetical protein